MRFDAFVADLDDLLSRLDADPSFRNAVERDPAAALAGFDLDDGGLRAIEAALAGDAPPRPADVRQWFSDR